MASLPPTKSSNTHHGMDRCRFSRNGLPTGQQPPLYLRVESQHLASGTRELQGRSLLTWKTPKSFPRALPLLDCLEFKLGCSRVTVWQRSVPIVRFGLGIVAELACPLIGSFCTKKLFSQLLQLYPRLDSTRMFL